MSDLAAVFGLAAIALVAASVNGALGYGFSSVTVPLALLFTTSRVLNPALVLVEVGVNLYVLAVNRASIRAVAPLVAPLVVGVVPGVVVGSLVLASVSPDLVKLVTYLVLLPLIAVQLGGLRRPLRPARAVGVPFGTGVGLLYSVTTISGPPLALFLRDQGYAQRDFRAALGLVRAVESSLTAVAYGLLGLYTPQSALLLPAIVPAVVVGVPLGAALIRRIDPESFRRVSMAFDALVVGFGLSRVVEQLGVLGGLSAYGILAAVAALDLVLLYRSFTRVPRAGGAVAISATGGD